MSIVAILIAAFLDTLEYYLHYLFKIRKHSSHSSILTISAPIYTKRMIKNHSRHGALDLHSMEDNRKYKVSFYANVFLLKKSFSNSNLQVVRSLEGWIQEKIALFQVMRTISPLSSFQSSHYLFF